MKQVRTWTTRHLLNLSSGLICTHFRFWFRRYNACFSFATTLLHHFTFFITCHFSQLRELTLLHFRFECDTPSFDLICFVPLPVFSFFRTVLVIISVLCCRLADLWSVYLSFLLLTEQITLRILSWLAVECDFILTTNYRKTNAVFIKKDTFGWLIYLLSGSACKADYNYKSVQPCRQAILITNNKVRHMQNFSRFSSSFCHRPKSFFLNSL